MSGINIVRNLQILYFSKKKQRNEKTKKWQKKKSGPELAFIHTTDRRVSIKAGICLIIFGG